MTAVGPADQQNRRSFWTAACWAVPYSLAAGVTLVACIAAAVAARDYYASPSLRIIGPAVAGSMASIGLIFRRSRSEARQGLSLGIIIATALLGFGTFAFALSH